MRFFYSALAFSLCAAFCHGQAVTDDATFLEQARAKYDALKQADDIVHGDAGAFGSAYGVSTGTARLPGSHSRKRRIAI